MMLLEKIEIENFGPYAGSNVIEIGQRGNALVIVHGENMAGKTSLLNAVRWGMYGLAKDRSGQPMPTLKLINSDSAREGHHRVSVTLYAIERTSESDIPVRLRRQRQARPGVSSPAAERD